MRHASPAAKRRTARRHVLGAVAMVALMLPLVPATAASANHLIDDITVVKTVNDSLIEVNPMGVTTPRTITWSIRAEKHSLLSMANVDVIDVLPTNLRAGNDFEGSLRFDNAAVVSGDNVDVRYTKTDSGALHHDANHSSNRADGATVWCDAPTGGAVTSGTGGAADCPQSVEDITGLRFVRPGSFHYGDAFQVDVTMTPIGNASSDVYRNLATGRAQGVLQGATSAISEVYVVASSIGNRVWIDEDADGLQDLGEVGLPGVGVRLVGTDSIGNAVDRSTVTDGSGRYLFAQLASGSYHVEFDLSSTPGYAFTTQSSGYDSGFDSDVDPATGQTDVFQLGFNTNELSIDAGVVAEETGGLVINKQLVGAGVRPFGGDDELTFSVVCEAGSETVFTEDVTLDVNGQTVVTSSVLGPIAAGAECTVTETDPGDADPDALPDPVTVLIPSGPSSATPHVTASLTNYYSAGTLEVNKHLDGGPLAVAAAETRVFKLRVSCQIEETTQSGQPVRADLYSGVVKIKGGQTKVLADSQGDPRALPLGARCFAVETDNGGAASSRVDYSSWENSTRVTSGTPEVMQRLAISATNTFQDAQLRVQKQVVGTSTGGAYSFGLVCTIPGQNAAGQPINAVYRLPDADARFSLRAGQSRTIDLPADVTCQATETAVPKGATVSVRDTDAHTLGGSTDGIVAKIKGTANSVVITNDFTRSPGTGGPGGGPGGGGPDEPSGPGGSGGQSGGGSGEGGDGPGGWGDEAEGGAGNGDGPLAFTGAQFASGGVLLGLGALMVGASLIVLRRRAT